MNAIVTARVPDGVKARGVDVLREIGSSTSELINAAFDYVIQERALPKPRKLQQGDPQSRTISPQQLAQVASFMENVKVAVPESWDNVPFENLLDSAREERYAHLR